VTERKTLIVMTRLPCEGRNKTRLIPVLGPAGATAMHDRLARHSVGMASAYAVKNSLTTLEIHLDGGTPEDGRKWLGEIECITQVPGDLGRRMQDAADRAFTRGAERIIIIGTDCPSLDEAGIAHAFDRLESSDIVLGPAVDGGYYLIGLTRPCPALFISIDWGSSRVLEQTLEAARKAMLHVALLEVREDVDLPSDLPAARAILNCSPFCPPPLIPP
jgi:rSAM/selenodomain-associated transferase 1